MQCTLLSPDQIQGTDSPKEHIYNQLYGSLRAPRGPALKVLDVGCGPDAKKHRSFRGNVQVEAVDLTLGRDWSEPNPRHYDLIVANDIFPNVDQRLPEFLEMYLPRTKEMRLSLTFWDGRPKWYRCERTDGDEILTMRGWIREQVEWCLPEKFPDIYPYSSFENGRQVAMVKLCRK